jgi:hypothetical protein
MNALTGKVTVSLHSFAAFARSELTDPVNGLQITFRGRPPAQRLQRFLGARMGGKKPVRDLSLRRLDVK